MKLIPHVHSQELELFSDQQLGFDVTVQWKQNDPTYQGETEVYHNVTEVHWRYNQDKHSKFPSTCPLGVALESDIHGTGGTRELHRLEYLDIQPATWVAEHF